MPAAYQVPSVFTIIDRYNAPLQRMGKGVQNFANRAEVALARVERRFIAISRSINRVTGGFGTLLGATAVFMVLRSGIGIIADFEQANANLASVMGVTVEQNEALRIDAERLGATTAKTATEVVGLQEAYARLGFTQLQILDVTEATIAGSIALRGELDETAELTGAVIKTFRDFDTSDTQTIIDQMTLATQRSALNFEKLQTAIPIVAGAANQANVPFNKLLALLGKLSDAGIDTSSSATALRNIFIDSAKQGLNFEQILQKIAASQDKLTASNDEFGKRTAVSAGILSENIDATAALSDILATAAKGQELSGVANRAAAKQLQTLKGSTTLLTSAYEGFILSLENGQGPFSANLRLIVDVTAKVLTMATAFNKGKETVLGAEETQEQYNERVERLASLATTAIKVIFTLAKIYLALKVAIIAVNVVTKAYNIILGISTALQGKNAFALRANAVAMAAYGRVVKTVSFLTKIWTGIQSAINVVLALNPIGLVVAAIAALIGVTTLIITKWEQWGAALSLVLFPLGMVISLVQSFRRNWDLVSNAFKTDGFVAGLTKIGAVIFDALLMPLNQVLDILSNISLFGFGDIAKDLSDGLRSFRSQQLGLNVESGPQPDLPPQPDVAERLSSNEAQDLLSTLANAGINPGSIAAENGIPPIVAPNTPGADVADRVSVPGSETEPEPLPVVNEPAEIQKTIVNSTTEMIQQSKVLLELKDPNDRIRVQGERPGKETGIELGETFKFD